MPNLHDIRLEDLRIFRAVARAGSFSGAAARLGYVQSAVSRHVAALERAAGGDLFIRLPRGVRLTAAGEELLGHAAHLLDAAATATRAIESVRAGQRGVVAVGGFPTANAALVPTALRELADRRPELRVTFNEGVSNRLIERVAAGSSHVAVVSDYPAGLDDVDHLDVEHLVDDPLLVALAADHPLARRRRPLRLADLAAERWIVAGGFGDAHHLNQACAAAGFVPDVAHEVAEWTAKLGFVSAGLGVTVLPGLAATAVRRDVVLRAVGDDLPPRAVSVVRRDRPTAHPGADELVACLRDSARRLHRDLLARRR